MKQRIERHGRDPEKFANSAISSLEIARSREKRDRRSLQKSNLNEIRVVKQIVNLCNGDPETFASRAQTFLS